MLWLNKHARTRGRLSQYIDATLSPPETAALEAHLATCEDCRHALDDLRSTVSAVRDLPQVETPRSFSLTPQMLERRSAAPTPSAPRFAVGMRMASAAVAVVLAVVVIGDLSNAGGNGKGREDAGLESGAESRNTMEFDAGSDMEEADAAAPAATTAGEQDDARAADEPAPTAASPPVEMLSSACPTAGDQTATGGAAPTPTATGAAICEEKSMADVEDTGAAATDTDLADVGSEAEADGEAAALVADDDGVSTLRILEIVLAGALMALLAAVAVDFASRRGRVA
jgi:hypothetical protein